MPGLERQEGLHLQAKTFIQSPRESEFITAFAKRNSGL
ncbi:hypothetical protein AK973_5005 [Pseudomonas brassicacearum]|nr:hypothetical protein AK973_5005 [Pseudomonas brassicacearum]